MAELTPYICVADSRAAIKWYRAYLGAEVVVDPIVMDDGHVGHCELAVDGARWMMSDAFESAGVAPPDPGRGNAVRSSSSAACTTCPSSSPADRSRCRNGNGSGRIRDRGARVAA